MSTAEDLRTFTLSDETVAGLVAERMYENTVPGTETALPFLWYRLARQEFLGVLGEPNTRPYIEFYDLEAVADDLGDAHDLAEAVRRKLEGHSGSMGAGVYAWVHVLDQYEDYVPRNVEADEHLQIVALAVEVFNCDI